jgi:hypothetical protein
MANAAREMNAQRNILIHWAFMIFLVAPTLYYYLKNRKPPTEH